MPDAWLDGSAISALSGCPGAAGEVSAKGGADVRSRPAPSFKAKSGRIDFSSQCARVRLTGVIVHNKGIDWQDSSNVYWQHKVRSTLWSS